MAHMNYIAYNPLTEEKIEFKSLPLVASYFGIGESTLRRWALYGMSVMELASEQDRPRLEATQSKLKGFEIYKATEWSEFNDIN